MSNALATKLRDRLSALPEMREVFDELDRLQAVNAELLAACKAFVEVAARAQEHWDVDHDARVGKILLAMAGLRTGYMPSLDAAHAAIAKAKGEA